MTKEEIEQYETLNKNFRSRGMELVCWYYVNYIKVTGENEGYWGMLFTEIQNHPEEVTVKIDEEKDEVVIEYLDADYDNYERYDCSFKKEFLWNDEAFRKFVADKVDEHYKTQELFEQAKNRIAELDAKKKEEEERALCLELMKKYGYGELINGKK